MGAKTTKAEETTGRPSSGECVARPAVEPPAAGIDATAGTAVDHAGVQRFRADLDCRVFAERAQLGVGKRDHPEMDDGGRAMETEAGASRPSAYVESA